MKELSVFQMALLHVALEDYSDIPAEGEIAVRFSPAYLQAMQKLSRRRTRRARSLGLLGAAACIALIAAFVLPRRPVQPEPPSDSQTSEQPTDHVVIPGAPVDIPDEPNTFSLWIDADEVAAAPKEIVTEITPSYTVTGYQLDGTGVDIEAPDLYHTYVGPAGERYFFRQSALKELSTEADGSIFLLQYADGRTEFREIGLYEVLAVYSEDTDAEECVSYYWTDHVYVYHVYADHSEQVNWEELAKLIESMTQE